MRHVVKVEISSNLTAEILTKGYRPQPFECITGLPEGAVLVNAFINRHGNLELHFEHPTFPEIAEGSEPSLAVPTFTTDFAPNPDVKAPDLIVVNEGFGGKA